MEQEIRFSKKKITLIIFYCNYIDSFTSTSLPDEDSESLSWVVVVCSVSDFFFLVSSFNSYQKQIKLLYLFQ